MLLIVIIYIFCLFAASKKCNYDKTNMKTAEKEELNAYIGSVKSESIAVF